MRKMRKILPHAILSDYREHKKQMQRPGIEPGSLPWQGSILPLDHRCLTQHAKHTSIMLTSHPATVAPPSILQLAFSGPPGLRRQRQGCRADQERWHRSEPSPARRHRHPDRRNQVVQPAPFWALCPAPRRQLLPPRAPRASTSGSPRSRRFQVSNRCSASVWP